MGLKEKLVYMKKILGELALSLDKDSYVVTPEKVDVYHVCVQSFSTLSDFGYLGCEEELDNRKYFLGILEKKGDSEVVLDINTKEEYPYLPLARIGGYYCLSEYGAKENVFYATFIHKVSMKDKIPNFGAIQDQAILCHLMYIHQKEKTKKLK